VRGGDRGVGSRGVEDMWHHDAGRAGVERGRITQEWTLFNEFEMLQQILRDDPVAGAT